MPCCARNDYHNNVVDKKSMFDGGTSSGKGGTTMAAVMVQGDHRWQRVWSSWTTCGADNLQHARLHTPYQIGTSP